MQGQQQASAYEAQAAQSRQQAEYTQAVARSNAEEQRRIAEENAAVLKRRAAEQAQAGQDEVNQRRLEAQRTRADIEARMIANGLDPSIGSAASVIAAADRDLETDAQTAETNYLRQVRDTQQERANVRREGYAQAAVTENEGNLAAQGQYNAAANSSIQASNARTSGFTNAFSSGVAGAGKVATRWYNWSSSS